MNLTSDRIRSIGWAAVLLTCFAFTVALTFKVNSVKSEVRLAERQIVERHQIDLGSPTPQHHCAVKRSTLRHFL